MDKKGHRQKKTVGALLYFRRIRTLFRNTGIPRFRDTVIPKYRNNETS